MPPKTPKRGRAGSEAGGTTLSDALAVVKLFGDKDIAGQTQEEVVKRRRVVRRLLVAASAVNAQLGLYYNEEEPLPKVEVSLEARTLWLDGLIQQAAVPETLAAGKAKFDQLTAHLKFISDYEAPSTAVELKDVFTQLQARLAGKVNTLQVPWEDEEDTEFCELVFAATVAKRTTDAFKANRDEGKGKGIPPTSQLYFYKHAYDLFESTGLNWLYVTQDVHILRNISMNRDLVDTESIADWMMFNGANKNTPNKRQKFAESEIGDDTDLDDLL